MNEYFVPGRIEVFGKHTDYAGGRSLLCAVERGFRLTVTPRTTPQVTVRDVRRKEQVEFEIGPDLTPERGAWSNYPMTVARHLARAVPAPWRGAEIAFSSDLPEAAGLSSSSAFVTAIFLALSDANDLPARAGADLADYLGAVERGVGTAGGSEDHTAILCAAPGALVQYAFGPARLEREVPLPAGFDFVVACSGVVAEKTGAALERYNALSRAAATILARWRDASGRDDATLGAALAALPDTAARIRPLLQEIVLRDRLEQFLEESMEVIPAAGDALARGDLAAFGAHADYSMDLATRLLGNQVPETVFLARRARDLGAVAASAFGAGFGGSVWALVAEGEAEDFARKWRELYGARFPDAAKRATFFTTRAGPPARRL